MIHQLQYLKLAQHIDISHRRFMALMQVELETRLHEHDITPVQALILFRLEDQEVPVGFLTEQGCYLGTNVNHNVKKMLSSGWLQKRHPAEDKRTTLVRATPRAMELMRKLNGSFERHIQELERVMNGVKLETLAADVEAMSSFWETMCLPPSRRPTALAS